MFQMMGKNFVSYLYLKQKLDFKANVAIDNDKCILSITHWDAEHTKL